MQAADALLQPARFKDYGPNGLQVEGKPQVRKLVSGVTASLALINAAIEQGADAAIGSRYVAGGGTLHWPLHRRLLSKWGNRYTGWALGVDVRDCTSGFRAYRTSMLAAVDQ